MRRQFFFSSKTLESGASAPINTQLKLFFSNTSSQPGRMVTTFKYWLPQASPYISERPSKKTLFPLLKAKNRNVERKNMSETEGSQKRVLVLIHWRLS